MIIGPFLWILLTGVVLWFLIAVRESSWPVRYPGAFVSVGNQENLLQRAIGSLKEETVEIQRISFPETIDQSLQVRMRDGETRFFIESSDQPIAKSRNSRLSQAIGIVQDLHRGKFAGFAGRVTFTLLAVVLIFYFITGAFLLRSRAGKTRARKVHRIAGRITIVPLVCIFSSGAIFNVASDLRVLPPFKTFAPERPIDWIGVMKKARRVNDSERVSLLAATKGVALVEFETGTRIYLDSSAQMFVRRPWTIRGWYEPSYLIHSGRILGRYGQLLILFVAFVSAALAAAGWYLRKRKRTLEVRRK